MTRPTDYTEKEDTVVYDHAPVFPGYGRSQYAAIVFLATAVFLLLCLISYDPRDPSFNVATTRSQITNMCGLIGSHVADTLAQLLGFAGFALPLGLIAFGARAFVPRGSRLRWSEALCVLLLISVTAVLFERWEWERVFSFPTQHAGGAVGAFFHRVLLRWLGHAGELVLSVTVLLLCALHLFKVSVADAARLAGTVLVVAKDRFERIRGHVNERRQERERVAQTGSDDDSGRFRSRRLTTHRRKDVDVEEEGTWGIGESSLTVAGVRSWERLSCLPEEYEDERVGRVRTPSGRNARQRETVFDCDEGDLTEDNKLDCSVSQPWKPVQVIDRPSSKGGSPLSANELAAAIDEYLQDEVGAGNRKGNGRQNKDKMDHSRPIKVTRRADEEIARSDAGRRGRSCSDDYKLPDSGLLDVPEVSGRLINEKTLEANAMMLEQKLADLGIKGEVVEVHPGPVITMFEVMLAAGIPLRKVLNTSDDLAMALKSGSTRVVAPIPGKDTLGIEVPNLNREIVYFREIVESPAFMKSTLPLTIAIGKRIDGEPFASSLARMPHLLIAGATGTGKSVGLNSIICSWLMTHHPDDLKLIMVDPKKLELSYYQDIPHLIHPVVTDPDKVPRVLSWAIREMERRYDLLSRAGAKNIDSYNQKIASGHAKGESKEAQKLPYLVIIVDELAELMMVCAKDIEISIARLAQMARAAGIHLILATQRPSVDVITGIIKANFPTRLSFQVSSKPDSRTILDTTGAENLLGMGDMLFLPPGTGKMMRLHGTYLSEDEIRRIVDFVKAQRSPVYLKEIDRHVSDQEAKATGIEPVLDDKYDEAVELVSRLGHASISLIQRHMRIGYNRAARMIEAMEAEGLIGPSDGTSRPREVLARALAVDGM